jgi:single-strand DNA-binding protein
VSLMQLSVVGYVGCDVQFRSSRSGTSVASFRVASTPRYYDRSKGRWADGQTTWLTVVCYRSLAHHVASSLQKGDPVVAVGRLCTQAWTRPDGTPAQREVLEAMALGHDLARGTSAFRKTPRLAESGDESMDVGAVIDDAEQAPSGRAA